MTVKGIELNDLLLTGIEFSFNSKGIVMSFNHRNDDTNEDELKQIYFHGVKNVFISHMELGDSSDIKISGVEFEESSDINKARFNFHTAAPHPEMSLTFDYVTILYSW